ncbi:MAG TPA: zf-HC2 domain-containing protein [Gemmatimonadaceae bacterium]|jgi:hypothetical protein
MTSTDAAVEHLDQDRMFAYVRHELDAFDEQAVDVHVASCSLCLPLVRELQEVYWTARTWQKLQIPQELLEVAAAQSALGQAVAKVRASNPALANRLAQWQRNVGRHVGDAIRLIVDSAEAIPQVTRDGLASLVPDITIGTFGMVMTTMPVSSAGDLVFRIPIDPSGITGGAPVCILREGAALVDIVAADRDAEGLCVTFKGLPPGDYVVQVG